MKKSKKILTLLGFFVLPFLVGMALLFRGYNSIGRLAKLYPISTEINSETKELDSVYYQLPDYKAWNIDHVLEKPNYLDSNNYMIGFFETQNLVFARKQLAYLSNLLEKHSGVKIVAMFNKENLDEYLHEDDLKLLERNSRLFYYGLNDSLYQETRSLYYPGDSIPAFYSLIDENGFIRVHLDIDDSRMIKKTVNILKYLDAEFYKNERVRVKQIKQ